MRVTRGEYEVITLVDIMAADRSQQKEAYTQLQQSLPERGYTRNVLYQKPGVPACCQISVGMRWAGPPFL